jgi:O-antigen/teichoic acid export membrane protein
MKAYNNLPDWAKGAVAVGGVLIVGIFGYKIYQDIKRKRELKDILRISFYTVISIEINLDLTISS